MVTDDMENGNEEESPEELDLSAGMVPHPTALQKGTPISYGGQPGRIVFAHPQIGVARVMMDDGKKLRSVNIRDLKVLPHSVVKTHIRRLNS